MAEELASLVVKIAGDADKYLKTLDKTQGKTQSWAGKIGGVASKALGGLVVGGALAAAGAVAAIGGAAFNVSRQTEQAAGQIAASLGKPLSEAKRFAEMARSVYGNNFADSVTGAGAVVVEVFKIIGDEGDAALQRTTESALALADSFGTDTQSSISAAKTLMDNFGVSSAKAFDLLAAGHQNGLDRGGDFIDTVEEYSTQFASGGASVEEFFTLLDSGLAGGMLGTDKAADAFKEFRVRIQDGSDMTSESLSMLGLDAESMQESMADGTLTAVVAFGQVMTALNETTDSSARMQAGVGLIGTQFEDLGTSALSLTTVGDQFDNLKGAADSLNTRYDNLGDAWEGIWRKMAVAISPATDALLGFANDSMPGIESMMDSMGEAVGKGIESVIESVGKMRTAWDNDYANIRKNSKDMLDNVSDDWIRTKIQAKLFMIDLRRILKDNGVNIGEDWESFWEMWTGFYIDVFETALSNADEFIANLRKAMNIGAALMEEAGGWLDTYINIPEMTLQDLPPEMRPYPSPPYELPGDDMPEPKIGGRGSTGATVTINIFASNQAQARDGVLDGLRAAGLA